MDAVAKTASVNNSKQVDHRRRIKILVVLLIIQAVFILVASFIIGGKNGGVELVLDTKTTAASKGETIDVDIILESKNKKINGVEMIVEYPEKKFNIVSVSPTNEMPILLQGPEISSNYFSATFVSQQSKPIKGKVVIARVKIQALEAGNHQLSFSEGSRVTAVDNKEFISPKTEVLSVTIK